MRIVVVGVNHSSAPLPVLERLSIPPGELDAVLSRLETAAEEAFVLSTCNRTEIYAVTANGEWTSDVERLLEVLAERGGTPAADVRQWCYMHPDRGAVTHALRVASGLDSMVLGEDQIQSQLKRALGVARGADTLGPTLERLGAAALSCGKRVRAFTGVGHHAVSLESVAVDAAETHAGPLANERVVVLGSGSSAATITRQLGHRGADVTIVGRSHGRAHSLAGELGMRSTPWERLEETLASARVVFCCTSAPHPVLTPALLARRVAERGAGDAPLLCVDLGMPRDVDPAVAGIDGTVVLTLEQLGRVARAHQGARRRHVPAAEAIVERETERFLDWVDGRGAAGTITRLRARADAVADTELRRALARLHHLDARDKAVVGELARRIVRKVIHDETQALKHPVEPGAFGESEEAVS